MKISFHNHSKSLISPIINKSQINKTFKEKIEPKQLSNIERDNILIDNITRNKREKTNITSLKLNSISKPKSLYIDFSSNKINSSNSNNNITKYNSTATTFSDKRSNKKQSLRIPSQISFKDKVLIKQTANLFRANSEEKNDNRLNRHRASATLAYLFYKENQVKHKNKLNFKKINYPLNELMKLDPYHYLPNGIKDTITKFKKINKKYNYPNLGRCIKTSRGNSLKALESNSILLRKADKRIHLLKKLLKIYGKSYDDLKYSVKWEGINHLWQKHTKLISSLLKNFPAYKWFLDDNEFMNYEKISEFFRISFQTVSFNENIKCFIEDLFDLFSEDKNSVNIKKIFCNFIITNNHICYEDKIDFLINVWESLKNEEINVKNIFYYIKNNLRYVSDYQKMISFFKKKFKQYFIFDKEQIYDFFVNDKNLRMIFERNCFINYKKVEENYNDVITNYFMTNIRGFNSSVSHHDVKSFCPKEIYGLEDILENIDRYNETKTEANDFLEEIYSSK